MGRSPIADRLTSGEQPMVYAVRSAVVNPREAQASTGVFSCALFLTVPHGGLAGIVPDRPPRGIGMCSPSGLLFKGSFLLMTSPWA